MGKHRGLCTAAVSVLFLALSGCTEVVYVDKDNVSGVEDGQSWATAFTRIQDGIDAAHQIESTGSFTSGEVWVAEGVYDELRPDSPAGSLVMKAGIPVYGHFQGTEGDLDERVLKDPARESVIDGTQARGRGQPAYHAVEGASGARLDGFTVTGGVADGAGVWDDVGGGMRLHSVSCVIANCVFRDNWAEKGGGMHVYGASPTIENCTFENNTASESGGAIRNQLAGTEPTITGCAFLHNSALGGDGGAIENYGAQPPLSDCTFTGNEAAGAGGAMATGMTAPTLTDCEFNENAASLGGALSFDYMSWPVLTRCEFQGNAAGDGSGVYLEYGSVARIRKCEFEENTGSVIFITGVTEFGDEPGATITNSLFLNNADAVIFNDESASVVATNCTFYGNAAGDAAVIQNFFGSQTRVTNSILWNDGVDEILDGVGGSSDVDYSDVQGGAPGVANLNVNPLFVNAAGGNLRLLAGSDCIDSGTDTSGAAYGTVTDDIEGTARPQPEGGPYDMGAYEQAQAAAGPAV